MWLTRLPVCRQSHRTQNMKGWHILVVEDETFLRKSLGQFCEQQGSEVSLAANLAEAMALLQADTFDVALLDIHLPDGNGLEFFKSGAIPSTTGVVVMTAEGGVRAAVEAIQHGAGDFLTKPFELETLPLVLSRLRRERSRQRLEDFKTGQEPDSAPTLFMGKRLHAIEQQMAKILDAERRLSHRLPPILLEGETGTGKSTLARWLHHKGPRASTALVEINASALPESLAEAELFGHERGAFTDARKERIGLFEAADSGTLFIDEIASLALPIQAKILTAIEDGQIRRIGSNHPRHVNIRLIAASVVPLRQMVDDKLFREDLYHRLNLLHLRIPALREFPEDLPALAQHILDQQRKRYRMPTASITPDGIQRLMAYTWPGNVRELQHEIERELIFAESGKISFANLPQRAGAHHAEPQPSDHAGTAADAPATLLNPAWNLPESGFEFEKALEQLTQAVIQTALRLNDDNASAAARQLGVSRDFIRYRLK